MELMIVASRLGLTKKLLRCYVDVQKHLKQLLKDPKSLSSLVHDMPIIIAIIIEFFALSVIADIP